MRICLLGRAAFSCEEFVAFILSDIVCSPIERRTRGESLLKLKFQQKDFPFFLKRWEFAWSARSAASIKGKHF